ncbi:MAG: glycosyltransferase [Candidatus Limnocylindrales bacterium]
MIASVVPSAMEEVRSLLPNARVTLVHDYLTETGGAERVVARLLTLFPQARLHASAIEPSMVEPAFAERGVETSFLGRVAADKDRAKRLFPLFPLAFRRMRLAPTDLVLSSSSGFAHHVRPPDGALHVCYCYTPPRFLWDPAAYFRGRGALRGALSPALAILRARDRRAAQRVDAYVAISQHTADRIAAVYGRESVVIHPPVAVDRFAPSAERSGRFLVVSRLVAYKRIDLAIQAATDASLPLDVIGEGPERARLERMAGPTIRFLGRTSDAEVRAAMARCNALVVPGTEDFGMTPVEAQASGRPPVAFAAGGALETIEDGVSGFLVREATPVAFAAGMRRAATAELAPERLVAASRRFDETVFRARLGAFLDAALERHAAQARPHAAERMRAAVGGSAGSQAEP